MALKSSHALISSIAAEAPSSFSSSLIASATAATASPTWDKASTLLEADANEGVYSGSNTVPGFIPLLLSTLSSIINDTEASKADQKDIFETSTSTSNFLTNSTYHDQRVHTSGKDLLTSLLDTTSKFASFALNVTASASSLIENFPTTSSDLISVEGTSSEYSADTTDGSLTAGTTLSWIYNTYTMEYINESSIFTQDGVHTGGGAQYRLGPVTSGINETFGLNHSQPEIRMPLPHQRTCMLYDFIIEAVFMGLLCLFGFGGNTLSMICLWRDKSKTATPFLLVSLEIADTMFLLVVFLLRVITSIHMFTGWFTTMIPIFPYLGSYVFGVALIAETGSIYLTVLVTVNRYISVCRPYEASDLCSIYHARRHVVFVVAFSIIFNLPRFFEYEVVKVVMPNNQTMSRVVSTEFANNIIYQIVYANALYFLVLFLVPLVLLIILNYKLIKALRKTKKKRAQLLSSSVDSQSRSEDDITLVLIVVVIIFIITQTPALVTQSLQSFLTMNRKLCPNAFFYYERISDLMVVANASMNFLVYCFCSTKFRQILVNLLCKKSLDSPEQSLETKSTRIVTKIRALKGSKGAEDSMV